MELVMQSLLFRLSLLIQVESWLTDVVLLNTFAVGLAMINQLTD